jgi:DNA repair exonuclease SbcCD ATPase subunit
MAQLDDNLEYDEIPGFTSYLYGKHRHRRPNEFVNAYKFTNHASELEENMGTGGKSREELVEVLEAIQLERRDALTRVQELVEEVEHREAKVKKADRAVDAMNTTLSENTEKMKEAAKLLDDSNRVTVKQRADLVKFGGHMIGCEYLEATYSGRRLSARAEKDLCSCGWIELLDKI